MPMSLLIIVATVVVSNSSSYALGLFNEGQWPKWFTPLVNGVISAVAAVAILLVMQEL